MLLSIFAVATPPLADTRPNIILIYSDDHARAAISAYGSPYIKTPNIDRLAKEGTLYTRHYSTNPLCAPSRAAILTGKYSHINGHKDNTTTFDQSQPTISKMLQSAGYETAVLGKWHLVSNPVGFDEWEVLRGQGLYYEPLFINSEGEHKEQGYTTELTLNDVRTEPYELGTAYGHIALSITDLDGELARLAGMGITPEKEPYSAYPGGSRICFVQDPDGYRIEMIEAGGRAG